MEIVLDLWEAIYILHETNSRVSDFLCTITDMLSQGKSGVHI